MTNTDLIKYLQRCEYIKESGQVIFIASHARKAGNIVGAVLALGGRVAEIDKRTVAQSGRYSMRTVYYIHTIGATID